MAAAKVLIVDDEAAFAEVIAERMRARGFDVDTAEGGGVALERVAKTRYDAVVLDLAMPGMDGMETMARMLAYDDTLQIIILTGHGSVQKGVDAVKAGAADFLEKPADIDELVGKVDEAFEKRLVSFQEGLAKKMSDLIKRRGW